MSAALALLAGTALWLDAASGAAATGASARLLAWHAVSVLVLAALGWSALWSAHWPARAGRTVAGLAGLLIAGGMLMTAGTGAAVVVPGAAAALFLLGRRWARHEIRW
ncbi:hypothetical protein [Ideonella sp.]|uniref:hypothetical protein n=1 Tax=Ideonella sp. TaxID=1929293 RepID=UPI0035B0C921